MLERHPSRDDFDSFLKGHPRTKASARNARILRHLLQDCTVCREHLNRMGWSKERLNVLLHPRAKETAAAAAPVFGHDYSEAFAAAERAVSSLLASEPPASIPATDLLSQLVALPSKEQVQRVEDPAFATPELARLLVARSHDLRFKDAGEMLHFANLARLTAESCSPIQAGDAFRWADLKARAWGQYGNSLRVCDRMLEAEEAFGTARSLLSEGTKDPLLRAWLLERIAGFLIFQESYPQAIEALVEAEQICQEIDERHLQSSALVHHAVALIYCGQTEQAIRTLNQAIPLIDPGVDPYLLFAACHNLIRCYIDLDRPDQALALYSETRCLFEEIDDPLALLRASWQEGQLLRDLGHLQAAEAAFLRSRKGFQERSLAREAAQVSLDLASVYVKQGKTEDVKRTVLATVPIFHALRVKLEILAALLQLQQVADQEQQALELIRSLSARVAALPKGKP